MLDDIAARTGNARAALPRRVQRAVGELKRGAPILLDGAEPLAVLAAETASAEGLADFAALSGGSPAPGPMGVPKGVLLLPPLTPAAPPMAFRLAALDAVSLPADPTIEHLVPPDPVPAPLPRLAESALALVKLGRLLPAVLVAAAGPGARAEAGARDLRTVSAADVLAYPAALATDLRRVADAPVPLADAADARLVAFRAPDSGVEHVAVVIGRPETVAAPLVRLHSECFTGDLLGSLRCDCGPQLRGAIRRIAEVGDGAVLYLAQEGRGIGLANKLRAYALQDQGMDTVEANQALGWGVDERGFAAAATMLRGLGIRRVRLLTNSPEKVAALTASGIEVIERVPHAYAPNGVNDAYLATKARRLGHLFA